MQPAYGIIQYAMQAQMVFAKKNYGRELGGGWDRRAQAKCDIYDCLVVFV